MKLNEPHIPTSTNMFKANHTFPEFLIWEDNTLPPTTIDYIIHIISPLVFWLCASDPLLSSSRAADEAGVKVDLREEKVRRVREGLKNQSKMNEERSHNNLRQWKGAVALGAGVPPPEWRWGRAIYIDIQTITALCRWLFSLLTFHLYHFTVNQLKSV